VSIFISALTQRLGKITIFRVAYREVAANHREVTRMPYLQHHLNSLHIFCRLRALGLSKATAIRLSMLWEFLIHPFVYLWVQDVPAKAVVKRRLWK